VSQKVLDALAKKFGDAVERTETQHGDEVAWIKRDKLVEVATWLRNDPAMAFDQGMFVTAIDTLDLRRPDANGAIRVVDLEAAGATRFEVCYQLRSLRHRHRVRLKIRVTEADPRVPSMTGLWSSFIWQERETFDMYGIKFDGHPDLRRIYLYEEFVGYPLRKDYPKDKRQPLVRRSDLPSSES
jgi:NADH-quinone oxidoreductase subunit C